MLCEEAGCHTWVRKGVRGTNQPVGERPFYSLCQTFWRNSDSWVGNWASCPEPSLVKAQLGRPELYDLYFIFLSIKNKVNHKSPVSPTFTELPQTFTLLGTALPQGL